MITVLSLDSGWSVVKLMEMRDLGCWGEGSGTSLQYQPGMCAKPSVGPAPYETVHLWKTASMFGHHMVAWVVSGMGYVCLRRDFGKRFIWVERQRALNVWNWLLLGWHQELYWLGELRFHHFASVYQRGFCSKVEFSVLGVLYLGQYMSVKWDLVKNRTQRAWRGLRSLAVLRYSNFLWSMNTVNK